VGLLRKSDRLRFLADESCDFAVVRALRDHGHDVAAVADGSMGADDEAVLGAALRANRILLTEDKDFGQLYYAGAHPAGGVILLRFPAVARRALADAVVELVDREGARLAGCFVVVQPGHVRILRRRNG
jgi:predicted nuclease of predicted toxin-antitoxin system